MLRKTFNLPSDDVACVSQQPQRLSCNGLLTLASATSPTTNNILDQKAESFEKRIEKGNVNSRTSTEKVHSWIFTCFVQACMHTQAHFRLCNLFMSFCFFFIFEKKIKINFLFFLSKNFLFSFMPQEGIFTKLKLLSKSLIFEYVFLFSDQGTRNPIVHNW